MHRNNFFSLLSIIELDSEHYFSYYINTLWVIEPIIKVSFSWLLGFCSQIYGMFCSNTHIYLYLLFSTYILHEMPNFSSKNCIPLHCHLTYNLCESNSFRKKVQYELIVIMVIFQVCITVRDKIRQKSMHD